jgi:hypothetical protein
VAEEDKLITEAKKLFEQYVKLEHSFDAKIADLYSDDALIQNKRKFLNGEVKVLTIPASKYKEIIKEAMPFAKSRGDISTYSDVKYAVEGAKVRVTATRYSELKKYSSPMSLLVSPNEKGEWLIYEELSESQQ